MADGGSFSPDNIAPSQSELVGQVSQSEALRKNEGVSLYKSSLFNVFVPKNPKIPLNEGLHVQVSDGHDENDSPKEVLARYTLALGSAKVLAESGQTKDAWANTRLEQGQVVSAYGRVPGVEDSWRKPVNTLNRNASEITTLEPNYNTQKLQKLCMRYLPKWEQLASNLSLFKNGINGKDLDLNGGDIVWENDNLRLEVIAKGPHLKGFHLVVSPKESFRRQWQAVRGENSEQVYIQQTLESTAVAMGVQKLLGDGKGELHNSGNWAGGLKSTEEGGKINFQNLDENKKAEKQLHRPDIADSREQIDTSMHVHVYIPEKGPVILPAMSKQEAQQKGRVDIVRQWDEIPPTSPEQLQEIKEKLGNGKLTKWLEENCR